MDKKTTNYIMATYTLMAAIGLMSLLLAIVWTKLSHTEREFDTYVRETLPALDEAKPQLVDTTDSTITVTYPITVK